MQLPVAMPEVRSQHFDCHSCTNCCRELVVHLTAIDRDKIDKQDWTGRLGVAPYLRQRREYVLRHKPGGGCVFLMDDKRCRIHAEYGLTEKPLACQLYPFTLHREGDTLRAGVRFDCPSAAANKGEPISHHRQSVRRLASELADAAALFPAVQPVELRRGCRIASKQLDRVVDRLDVWLRDADRPLDDRLLGLCSLCDTLEAARLDAISDEQIGDLLTLLVGELESAAPREDLSPPTDRHFALLRMTVFAHCEHVTLGDLCAPWRLRWRRRVDQLLRGRRMVRGLGDVPPLMPGAPAVAFERVDRVRRDPATPPQDVDELLTRYVRMRLLSHSAFGDAYYGWSVIDGLRALVLSIAAVRWLARYLAAAAGRDTWQLADLQKAIGLIDRGAGRAKELGRASGSLRVRFFARDHGLARLIFHDSAQEGTEVSAATTAG
ncbi:MAG TPA: YkgJ family cysteine cluster protein [Phycisphaerae bacterium]|nr:YkgJ family cysteine cluster protein [Phycisphaerae bacterium]